MFEFLIRWLDEEPSLGDNYRDILRPNTLQSQPIEGRDVYCISVNGCEISFSWEMPGIQVTVDESCALSANEVQTIVEEIADNIMKETGVQVETVRFDASDTNIYEF